MQGVNYNRDGSEASSGKYVREFTGGKVGRLMVSLRNLKGEIFPPRMYVQTVS